MTLVSVIGDFFSSVTPVFYDFSDKITTHIIISDNSKRDSYYAKKFKNGVRDFCLKKNKNITQHFVIIDEDSSSAIDKVCEYIIQNSAGEIYVNISDGLAALNTVMTQKLLPKGVKFVSYDIFDNEYHVLDRRGIIERRQAKAMNIQEHFLLKGVEVFFHGDLNFAVKNEEFIKKIFENYHNEYRLFKFCLTVNPYDKRYKSQYKKPTKYNFPNIYKCLNEMGLSFSSDKQLLTGGLFEYYIYLLLKNFDFDDIAVSTVVYDNNVKNEYDVLVIKNNHLHIIECKHKAKTLDINDVVYKYAALKKMVDYDSKAVIVSLKSKIKEMIKKRAESFDIKLVNLSSHTARDIYDFLKD